MGLLAFLGLIGVLWLLYIIAKNTGDSRDRQQEILLSLKQLQIQLSEQKNSSEPSAELANDKPIILPADTQALVNINQAEIQELQTLPGVGKALAQKIISRRPIGSIDELLDVPGISEDLLHKLREKISLS
jgi:competence ComEA-like helix-hairpin-helix protein